MRSVLDSPYPMGTTTDAAKWILLIFYSLCKQLVGLLSHGCTDLSAGCFAPTRSRLMCRGGRETCITLINIVLIACRLRAVGVLGRVRQ